MGASDRQYFSDIVSDPEEMLADLHRRTFAAGEYYWAQKEVPRPADLAGQCAVWGYSGD